MSKKSLTISSFIFIIGFSITTGVIINIKFNPLVPDTFWKFYIFTPCNTYLKTLLLPNSKVAFQDNVVWFNVSDYIIERTYDYSTGILSYYRIFFNKHIVFSSELLYS